MASLYDERVLGAQQRAEFARKLRESSNQPAGQMVSGWYVPNTGAAVVDALRNIMGAYQEREAKDELKNIQREKLQSTIQAMGQAGISAPESMLKEAGTEEEAPSWTSRASAFLRGEEQPKPTPAQPYQQNVAQNVTREQRNAGLSNLIAVNPEYAQNVLALEKMQADEAKDARKAQLEKVPTGFTVNEQGQLSPMPIAGYGNYADYQTALARQKEGIISPVEAQNMQVQQARLGLDITSSQRAEEAAKRAEEATNQQKMVKQWEFENPNANKNLAEIQNAQAENEKLQASLKSYRNALANAKAEDIYDPRKNAELQSAYQAATWPLRGETLMNTGVLNPGEMGMLNKALTDPSSAMGMVRGKEELLNQIDKVLETSNINTRAIAKSRLPSPPPGMENTPYWTGLKRFAEEGAPKESAIPDKSAIQAEIERRQKQRGQ